MARMAEIIFSSSCCCRPDNIAGRSHIWVIATANRADLLNGAIRSRLGWQMTIDLADSESRREIFTQELRALGIVAEIPSNVEQLTHRMSGRDLYHLAASVHALQIAANRPWPSTSKPSQRHESPAAPASKEPRHGITWCSMMP